MKILTKLTNNSLFQTMVSAINDLIDNSNDSITILDKKLSKEEVISGKVYKGTCAYADLPTTGQESGDYWGVSDGPKGKGYYIWNGTAWKYAAILLRLL